MANLTFLVLLVAVAIGAQFYFHQPYRRHNVADRAAEEYDYIVVGGGSAGSVLAARLSEDTENTVLLLEAGGFYDETPAFHSPPSWITLKKTQYSWNYYTEPQTGSCLGMHGQQSYWPRGRVLGGSGMTNAMQYTRGSRFDFDEWAAGGCAGWSYKDVLPYFLKSEDIQMPDLKTSSYHNSGGPLAITGGFVTEIGPLYLKAGKEMGYDITDYNGQDMEGFSEMQYTIRNGVRSSTAEDLLGKTGERENLDILLHSHVTKVHFQNNVAVGVSFIKDNRKLYVKARKEVILSAGAINTPQLLMLSGIGPRQHLSEMGIPVVADLPVGKNLQDHVGVYLLSKITKPIGINSDRVNSWLSNLQYTFFGTGVQASIGAEVYTFLQSDDANANKTYPDVWLISGSTVVPPEAGYFFNMKETTSEALFSYQPTDFGMFTVPIIPHPRSKGTITLKSKDLFDHPIIDPRYFTEKGDIETLVKGIRMCEQMLQTETMKELGASIVYSKMSFCSQHEFRSDDYWECYIRHVGITTYHYSGTCKMGPSNDPTAVVNPELRVRGIKGLRVVDTSIFPNVTTGNTNAPTIMVAEKASDLIRGKDTVRHLERRFA